MVLKKNFSESLAHSSFAASTTYRAAIKEMQQKRTAKSIQKQNRKSK